MIDRRPALIAGCANADDVVRALRFALREGMEVAVRGGGHSVAGKSLIDGGFVVDLSAMKGIAVDARTGTARAEPGLSWNEFDGATQRHGLATTGGIVSSTGIAGLTLGGGVGWLAGRYGLTCDNLLGAELVTADGSKVRANPSENPDLFWGLRGGGGNLGIVTAFEYRVHPVREVLAGVAAFSLDGARELLRFYRTFSADVPDELTTAGVFATVPQGPPIFAIFVVYNGPVEAGWRILGKLKEVGHPVQLDIRPMPYASAQGFVGSFVESGLRNYWKSQLMRGIPDEVIEILVDHFRKVPSPLTGVAFQQIGAAARRVPRDATAFAHRDALYDLVMLSRWRDPREDDGNVGWTRALWQALQPYSSGAVYVNNLGDEDRETVRTAYGPNYERLLALKRKWDPENVFRRNQNIDPKGT